MKRQCAATVKRSELSYEIYEAACIVIRRQKKASISLLQRRFRIGYVRAARIMARIEDSGLLSELFLVEQGDGGFR